MVQNREHNYVIVLFYSTVKLSIPDDGPKQQKSSHEQKINPLVSFRYIRRYLLRNASISIQLILLLVCVILTWGVAATLVFNLVDYKGMAGKVFKYFAL